MKYPINEPNISELETSYVLDVLKENWLSAGGKHTRDFEDKLSDYVGVKFSLAVQSGTAALHLALKAIGVTDGDNVIIPNYSCGATISAVKQCNAIPVVIDVEADTYGMNIKNLELAIKKYKPKALQFVHVYGFPAQCTSDLVKLCKKYKVTLLEDAAEALGMEIDGKKAGTFGDISIFSIRSEKMIGVGEGGVVLTSNDDLFEKVKELACRSAPHRGSDSPYWKKYYYNGEGYNYMLPHLLGAVAKGQMERFETEILAKKVSAGMAFRKVFSNDKDFTLQKIIPNSKPCFWLNSIVFNTIKGEAVRSLGQYLVSKNIEVRSGFLPLSEMPGFNPIKFESQQNGKHLYGQLLVLPSSGKLKIDDFEYFYNLIKEYTLKYE